MSYIANHHKKNKAPGCLIPFFGIFGFAGFAIMIAGISELINGADLFDSLFPILFSLPFIGIGVGGIIWIIRSRRSNPLSHLDDKVVEERDKYYHHGEASYMDSETELQLKSSSPIGKLIAILIFAALWNGGISIPIFTEIIPSFESGDPEWGLTLFMSIFALIGLLLIGLVIYSILALANPRPNITISTNHLRLGQRFSLYFELNGNVHSITSLTFRLKGIESATYRRGTDTITRTETFFETELAQFTDSVDMRSGTIEVNLPINTMPSWEASNNKVQWRIELNGDIPKWPDIDETYNIVIYPAIAS